MPQGKSPVSGLWVNELKASSTRSVTLTGLRTRPVAIRLNEAPARPANPADLSGRIPHYQRMTGDIMGNHSTRAYACPSANGYPSEDHNSRSDRGAFTKDDALRVPIRGTLQVPLRIGRTRITVIREHRCRTNKCEITDDRWLINKRVVLDLHVHSESDPRTDINPAANHATGTNHCLLPYLSKVPDRAIVRDICPCIDISTRLDSGSSHFATLVVNPHAVSSSGRQSCSLPKEQNANGPTEALY